MGKSLIKAKRVKVDGIRFASKLESNLLGDTVFPRKSFRSVKWTRPF